MDKRHCHENNEYLEKNFPESSPPNAHAGVRAFFMIGIVIGDGMKSDVFNYSYQYMNWHSDTPESRECDINSAKCFCDAHGLYPKSRDAQVLEIGCGMGRFLLMLQNSGYENLRGIDIDKSQIEIAKHENLNVSLDDTVEFLTLASEKYDVIYAFDVLEHIDKEKQLQLLRMMFDRTIDGGFVAFSVPNGLAPLAGYYRYTDFTL